MLHCPLENVINVQTLIDKCVIGCTDTAMDYKNKNDKNLKLRKKKMPFETILKL
jgi:hypothetical protein